MNLLRRGITVNGIVQGVGFRPFVYSLALDCDLGGHVSNTSEGVKIEIQGTPAQLENFEKRLRSEAPPLSEITSITSIALPLKDETQFSIVKSEGSAKVSTLISPDMAVCPDCLKELVDPMDRRYQYPFINCTNCGPRYTIIENIPYDRPYTSMRGFPLCPACREEYSDPLNRRFHAQPNACPVCGPKVWITDAKGNPMDSPDPITQTIQLLKSGKCLAIKGLGGFHLCVNAQDARAIAGLRAAKGRDEKPFALMVKDIQTARSLVHLSPAEEAVLCSQQAPIVLAQQLNTLKVAPNVAPGNERLGIMLPYTPLHHILLSRGLDILVMTSANFSEEPIAIDNDEALARLGTMVDAFLLHDRDIYLRSDDSVVIELAGRIRPVRRSRGYAPRPIFAPSHPSSHLAVGGELKNVIALSKADKIFMSQHIGDLENLAAYEFFKMTIDHLCRIFEIQPDMIVHDLHPEYLSTKWALEQDLPVLGVQHHHAHLAACLEEHGIHDPVIGIIMDGTGYGTDGSIWGGEFLVGNQARYERAGHFEPMPLPGGSAAIKAPWRLAVAYLTESMGEGWEKVPWLKGQETALIEQMVRGRINTPMTTSCGRLFDAVAALSGGRQEIHYEAQAAIEFMQAAGGRMDESASAFSIRSENGKHIILIKPIMEAVLEHVSSGSTASTMSQWFHKSLILTFAEMADRLREQWGLATIVLSGGVFQNALLFEGLLQALDDRKFSVLTHTQVPSNDGGIALGQIAVARAQAGATVG